MTCCYNKPSGRILMAVVGYVLGGVRQPLGFLEGTIGIRVNCIRYAGESRIFVAVQIAVDYNIFP